MEPLAARNSHRFACTDPVRNSPRAANVGWAQHDAHEPVVVAIKGESLLNPHCVHHYRHARSSLRRVPSRLLLRLAADTPLGG